MRARDQRCEILRLRPRQRRFQTARGEEQIWPDAAFCEVRQGLHRPPRRSRSGFLPKYQNPLNPTDEVILASAQEAAGFEIQDRTFFTSKAESASFLKKPVNSPAKAQRPL